MASDPPSLPTITGLDVAALGERLHGDRGLVCSVLIHFAATQRNAADHLPELVQKDPPAALLRAHDLKGVLGNLGAQGLHAQATRLCELLRTEPPDRDAALVPAQQLQVGLPRLCNDIDQALPTPPATAPDTPRRPTAGAASGATNAFIAQLDLLAERLRRGRAREAKQTLAALRELATAAGEQVLVDDITPLVTGYRLRDALRVVEQHRHG